MVMIRAYRFVADAKAMKKSNCALEYHIVGTAKTKVYDARSAT